MKSIALKACTIALLAAAAPAYSQEMGPRYYAGDFSCRDASFSTEWVITPNANGVDARVYYQQVGSERVNWLHLAERRLDSGNGLVDANGNPHILLVGNSERMQATWANRAGPGPDCQSFIVQRSEGSKARFDAIFALMETTEPDEATAIAVGEQTRHKPIVFALPELDQQAYSRRYQELAQQFWSNYRLKLSSDLAAMPLSTEAETGAFANRITAALEGGLAYDPSRNAHDQTYALMLQAADRLAFHGASAVAFYSGAQDTCARFQDILAKDPWYDFKKLELSVRVPVEYWSRQIADDVIVGLRSCEGVDGGYVRELTNKWPDFQQRREVVATLAAEQARLLTLPVTVATLVETNNLAPSEDVAALLRNRSDYRARFFGAPLHPRRLELLEMSLAWINEEAAGYTGADLEGATSVVETCAQLGQVSNFAHEDRGRVRNVCREAELQIAGKQADAALAQVEKAFAGVLPESEQVTQARELCSALRSALPYEARVRVGQACDTADSKLLAQEKELRCERAVAASGASADLLESSIALKSGDITPVRNMVCRASENRAELSFASSGFMMWGRQTMLMKISDTESMTFVLSPAEGQLADWQLIVEDEATAMALASMDIKVEAMVDCLIGLRSCRP